MPPLVTVLDTIEKGTHYLEKKGILDARRNMQLLVTHQLNCSPVELYLQFDRQMAESELAPLRDKLKRRGAGEPLQHILGSVEFYRREFKSDARALVPRPETEELADIILKHPALKSPPLAKMMQDTPPEVSTTESTSETQPEPSEPSTPSDLSIGESHVVLDPIRPYAHLEEDSSLSPSDDSETNEGDATEDTPNKSDNRLRILDMGTGSGVLGLTLSAELGGRCSEAVLVDISPEALSLAGENAELLGLPRHQLIESNLYDRLEGEKFHLIVANLPYIAESDRQNLSSEVLRDPDTALFGGSDGLSVIRDFIEQTPDHLLPGGMLALEIGHDQADAVEALLIQHGFTSVTTHKDLNQIPRFPIAFLPESV